MRTKTTKRAMVELDEASQQRVDRLIEAGLAKTRTAAVLLCVTIAVRELLEKSAA